MGNPPYHQQIRMCGLEPASFEQWIKRKPFQDDIKFEFTPAPGGIDLLLTSEVKADLASAAGIVNRAWGPYCYTLKGETIEAVVGALLLVKKKTIAIAESCTGGRIASRITRIPGSSGYFESACVTYSNRSKERLLSVFRCLLEEKGAVSPEVAKAMADGIRRKASVDLGLAVTGIAGPGGGSLEKPVGRVYIALSYPEQTKTMRHDFPGDREMVQSAAVQTALDMVRRYLLGHLAT